MEKIKIITFSKGVSLGGDSNPAWRPKEALLWNPQRRNSPPLRGRGSAVKTHFEKRIFDIIVSLTAIVLFSPFIFLVLISMFIENIIVPSSRGKIFYSEIRISAGEPFKIYKFRIFKMAALERAARDNSCIHTKPLEGDPKNLTYVGRFLKRIYMDELPQIYNVLRGDMSLVGPRPTNIENSEKLFKEGKYSKYLAKAGLTGYFQSHKGFKTDMDQEEIDMEYINFCRNNPGWKVILYDIKIIFISILTVLRAEGV